MMPSAPCDRISDLNDDLLLHVLRFLSGDARDVVRTSTLSTRWRDLWTRAPVLRLRQHKHKDESTDADGERLNDFVDNVLARRAHDADVETLKLCAGLWPGKSRADVWLRRAMRHTVGSLEFELRTPPLTGKDDDDDDDDDADSLRPWVDLPRCTRLKKMWLELGQAVLLLPPALQFHKLTELTLCSIEFSDEDGPRLGHLLSSPSCCPRLRKLKLWRLSGLHELRLDGGALEILNLGFLFVRHLHLDAPRLSVLQVGGLFKRNLDDDHTSTITVRAPALEKLEAVLFSGPLELQRHTVQLLQECRPIHGHTIHLNPKNLMKALGGEEEDAAMTDMPQLSGVTNMTLKLWSENSHNLGAAVASLLARCSNLKYLHLDNLIHLYDDPTCEEGCADCDLRGNWKDDVISLKHLREVKLGGFSGQEHYCVDMLHLLLASAPALNRMIVTAKSSIKGRSRPKLMLAESLESSLPCGKGKWTTHRNANATVISEYKWTPRRYRSSMSGRKRPRDA